MTTYGNLLYEFCLYNQRLKSFKIEQKRQARINTIKEAIWEVTQCISNDEKIVLEEDFYKSHSKKQQKTMMTQLTHELDKDI